VNGHESQCPTLIRIGKPTNPPRNEAPIAGELAGFIWAIAHKRGFGGFLKPFAKSAGPRVPLQNSR
jgi:hypothetical protein